MITIIGAGKIGSSIATHLIYKEFDDLLLLDVINGLPQGEALDLSHMASAYGIDFTIRGSNEYKDINDSEIVIVTAGLARKPGMTRLDLLNENSKIIKQISLMILEYVPKTKILMVTNPLDIMTYLTLKVTGFESSKVFGMGGILDSSRFRYIISKNLNVPVSNVEALVIGEHGEYMVPLPNYSTVYGKKLSETTSKEEIDLIIDKTRKSAAEVISLKGATMHAPGVAVANMVDSIINNKNKIFPLSTYLNGEYNVNDVCIGVPAELGINGVGKINELILSDDEKIRFYKGVQTLKKAISNLNIN